MQTRQTRAAILLASGQSKQDSAKAVGVDPSTLRRWLKAPEFNAILRLETDRAEARMRAQISRAEAVTFKRAVTNLQNLRQARRAKKFRENEKRIEYPPRITAHFQHNAAGTGTGSAEKLARKLIQT
jgi:hypothetical protein